jgi:hypothetical protein
VAAEAAVVVAAFAAAAVDSIAEEAVASIVAVVVMAEVMASMARPSLLVRAAGGTPTATASAGGDPGSIAVA